MTWRGDRTLSAWFIVFLALGAMVLGELLPVWFEQAPPGTPGAKESMFSSLNMFFGTVFFYTVLSTVFWRLFRTLNWTLVALLAAVIGTTVEWFVFRPQEATGPNVVEDPAGALLFFLVVWPILLVLPYAIFQVGRRYGWRWVGLGMAFLVAMAIVLRPAPPTDIGNPERNGSPILTEQQAARPVEDDKQAGSNPNSEFRILNSGSFQWQLSGLPIDMNVDADIYEIDGLDNPKSVVDDLHAKGRTVICYVDVGSWEDFRDDKDAFPTSVLGKVYVGFEDERWLDIRQIDQLTPILEKRFDSCRDKGFDAVEADNVDGFEQDTGFPLTAADQLAFNRWVADEVHKRGMSAALKNDGTQAAALEPYFDLVVTEECVLQDICEEYAPFRAAGKLHLNAEYTDTPITVDRMCTVARAQGFTTVLKHRNLDLYRVTCD